MVSFGLVLVVVFWWGVVVFACFGYWQWRWHFGRARGGDVVEMVEMGAVLLVQAHPDDEVMFFAPTLVSLRMERGYFLYILCLSKGDQNVRVDELKKAIKNFGLNPEEHLLIDDLQDGEQWSNEQVSKRVSHAVHKWNIKTIITFDEYGVSGHPNHISCHHGVKSFLSHTPKILGLKLISLTLFQKYLWFPIPPKKNTSFNPTPTISNRIQPLHLSNPLPNLVHKAMTDHKSQYIWFRKIYVFTSRYVHENILVPI